MKSEYVALEDLVRTRYASVAWTHKIQEKQAEIYDKRYRILATVNIFAASITSAGIFFLDIHRPDVVKDYISGGFVCNNIYQRPAQVI